MKVADAATFVRPALVGLGSALIATPAAASDFSPMYYMALGVYLAICFPVCLIALATTPSARWRKLWSILTAVAFAPMLAGPYAYAPVGLYGLFGLTIGTYAWSYIGFLDFIVIGFLAVMTWLASEYWHKRRVSAAKSGEK